MILGKWSELSKKQKEILLCKAERIIQKRSVCMKNCVIMYDMHLCINVNVHNGKVIIDDDAVLFDPYINT